MTLTIKPTPTICIATSLEIPNREHPSGTRRSEPPATPEAPHAENVAIILSRIAIGRVTWTPAVFAADRANVVMTAAAPSMLIVAPSGIDTEYISSSRPSSSQSSMLTGIFAAELLVKKAVTPLWRIHLKMSGYGLCFNVIPTISGLTTSATMSMEMTSTRTSSPYTVKISRPLVETASYTRPRIPNGAQLMIQRTTLDVPSARSSITFLVPSPAVLRAKPNMTAQNRIPM